MSRSLLTELWWTELSFSTAQLTSSHHFSIFTCVFCLGNGHLDTLAAQFHRDAALPITTQEIKKKIKKARQETVLTTRSLYKHI